MRFIYSVPMLKKIFSSKGAPDINPSNLSVGARRYVEFFLKEGKVIQLSFMFTLIEEEGIKTLVKELPNSHVQDLYLVHTDIGNNGVKALAKSLPNSHIQTLCLWGNLITSEGCKALANILPSSQIQKVDLSKNNIGIEGVVALAENLPYSQVRELILSCNHIGNGGVQALADKLAYSQVQRLHLSESSITTKGVKALAKVLPHSQIQSLDLRYNVISPEGVEALITGLKGSNVTAVYGIYHAKLKSVLQENQKRINLEKPMIAFGEGMAKRHAQMPTEVLNEIATWLPENNYGNAPQQNADPLLGEGATCSLISAAALNARQKTLEKINNTIELYWRALNDETEHLNDNTIALRRVIKDNPQLFFQPKPCDSTATDLALNADRPYVLNFS